MLGYKMNWHRTYGAIYNDNRDSIDGNDYTYVSYVQDGILLIAKIQNIDSSAKTFDPVLQKLVSSFQTSHVNATSMLREDQNAWNAVTELFSSGEATPYYGYEDLLLGVRKQP